MSRAMPGQLNALGAAAIPGRSRSHAVFACRARRIPPIARTTATPAPSMAWSRAPSTAAITTENAITRYGITEATPGFFGLRVTGAEGGGSLGDGGGTLEGVEPFVILSSVR